MRQGKIPQVGDSVGLTGHTGVFWITEITNEDHTVTVRSKGNESYRPPDAPVSMLIYPDSVEIEKQKLYINNDIERLSAYLEKAKTKYQLVIDELLGTGKSDDQITVLKREQTYWANECTNIVQLINALKDRLQQ